MERKGIIRLLCISLAVHMFYMIFMVLFMLQQDRILAMYGAPFMELLPVLDPYMILPELVLFLLHVLWTVKFVMKLSGGGFSYSLVWIGTLLFGGCFHWLAGLGDLLVARYAGFFHGDSVVASYNIFRNAAAINAPIRMIAVTLLLLAVGMSVASSSIYRDGIDGCQKRIESIWRISLIPEAVFLVLLMLIVMFQNQLKGFLIGNDTELIFIVPIVFGVGFLRLFLLHIILFPVLVYQQKQGISLIVCEILGVLAYSGILGWPGMLMDYAEASLVAREGLMNIVNFSGVSTLLNLCCPVYIFGRSLFIVGCGMSIYRKLHREHIPDSKEIRDCEIRDKEKQEF